MSDEPVVERFVEYLREHNLPVTAQRLAIAEVMLTSARHLSAEEVAQEVSATGRKFGEGFRRFEPARDIPHHEHLVCTQCGKVEEFRDERLERMTTLVAETRGFARQSHRLVIMGVCRDCQSGGAGVTVGDGRQPGRER